MRMRLSRRATVGMTVVAMAAVGVPAFAGGHGGGGGGGGNPGTKPYIEFKAGGAFTVTEGTANAVIQVERVPKAADSVYFSTNGSPNGAVGAADCSNPATDYIVVTSQIVSIGTNGVGVATVPICNNSFFENSETVNLLLSQRTTTPVGGKITGTLTINDNDKAPVLSVNNKTGAEGTTQTFTVTASTADPLLPMSVHWSTSDGTATVADGDYASQSGDVAIAPGNTTATFDVTSLDDGVFEPGTDEYFWVNLSAPVNSSVSSTAGSGKYTVQDIDAPPTLSVNDVTDWEGNVIGFTVTRTGMTTGAATFDWTTSSDADALATASGDPNNVCGVNANDYISAGAHNVSIAPGGATASTTVNVTTCEDVLQEDNEKFHVYLSSPAFATISDDTGVGTIRDNDPYNTTVVTDPSGGVTQGTMVLETATVTNKNGDPLPGITVRGELWRDSTDASSDSEADGNLFATGSVVTDSNGQVTGGPYTDTDGFFVVDWLYVCVPGYDGATSSSCGVDLGAEGDGEELLATPAPPSTIGWTSVTWNP